MPRTRAEVSPKKVVMVGAKVDEPTREILDVISRAEDRPVGYVVRELMLRGLAAYQRDGKLKEPANGSELPDEISVRTITIGDKKGRKKNTA